MTTATAPNGVSDEDAEEENKSNAQLLEEALSDPSLTEAEKQQLIEKYSVIENAGRSRASYPARSLAVPAYRQETNYWCGPATAKQTVQYLAGSSQTQAQIAAATGTTTAGANADRIISYVNDHQSKNIYARVNCTSQTQMVAAVDYSLSVQHPMILTLAVPDDVWEKGIWPYWTNGHYLNVSGQSAGASSLTLTDPFYYEYWVGAGNGILTKATATVYQMHINLTNSIFY